MGKVRDRSARRCQHPEGMNGGGLASSSQVLGTSGRSTAPPWHGAAITARGLGESTAHVCGQGDSTKTLELHPSQGQGTHWENHRLSPRAWPTARVLRYRYPQIRLRLTQRAIRLRLIQRARPTCPGLRYLYPQIRLRQWAPIPPKMAVGRSSTRD